MDVSHHATIYRVRSTDLFELQLSEEEYEVYEQYNQRFSIDDARQLIHRSHIKPQHLDKQLLVVKTDFLTHEAQNALLKLLEEPPSTTAFVFVISHHTQLLPTLSSRCHEQPCTQEQSSGACSVFDDFLQNTYKNRLAQIDNNKKDVMWQQDVKEGLIDYLKSTKSTNKVLMKECEYVARKLLSRGASNKMLLEQVALVLPTR